MSEMPGHDSRRFSEKVLEGQLELMHTELKRYKKVVEAARWFANEEDLHIRRDRSLSDAEIALRDALKELNERCRMTLANTLERFNTIDHLTSTYTPEYRKRIKEFTIDEMSELLTHIGNQDNLITEGVEIVRRYLLREEENSPNAFDEWANEWLKKAKKQ